MNLYHFRLCLYQLQRFPIISMNLQCHEINFLEGHCDSILIIDLIFLKLYRILIIFIFNLMKYYEINQHLWQTFDLIIV